MAKRMKRKSVKTGGTKPETAQIASPDLPAAGKRGELSATPHAPKKAAVVGNVLVLIACCAGVMFLFFICARDLWDFLVTGAICTGKKYCSSKTFGQAPFSVSVSVFGVVLLTFMTGVAVCAMMKGLADGSLWRIVAESEE